MELVVIALIGWEIDLSIKQDRQQSDNFQKQQKQQTENFEQAVLTNMLRTSQATATTLVCAIGMLDCRLNRGFLNPAARELHADVFTGLQSSGPLFSAKNPPAFGGQIIRLTTVLRIVDSGDRLETPASASHLSFVSAECRKQKGVSSNWSTLTGLSTAWRCGEPGRTRISNPLI